MGSTSNLNHESFVRDLPYSTRCQLASMLDPFDTWENLAATIPLNHKNLTSGQPVAFQARFTSRDIFAFQRSRRPTKALLEDWECENCQIKHLIQALLNANLSEAANFLNQLCVPSRVQEEMGVHVMSMQSGRREDMALQDAVPESVKQIEQYQVQEEIHKDVRLHLDEIEEMPEIKFERLNLITRNFDGRDRTQGGNLIGTGGFGDVYLGEYWSSDGSMQRHRVAVKRLKDSDEESLKQFETEVKTLCTYKHEHLVTLLGFSADGPSPCLVYEYVMNGSLEDRLACLHNSPPLSVLSRLDIARGTAKGIEYLHEKSVTHRDIKTANILLDSDFNPKVSDFATARTLLKSADMKTQVMRATTIIGTTSYLAPEAYDFKIHPGLDVYSFGVVILELITGLPVFDRTRENEDLKIHVQEYCSPEEDDEDDNCGEDDGDKRDSGTILDLLDKKPGVVWSSTLAEDLYKLALQCLQSSMKLRKKIKFVVSQLNSLRP